MEVGIHKARVKDYGISETKDGNPQMFIVFNVENENDITWYGSFNAGKAMEITLTNIIRCGFPRGAKYLDLIDGIPSGLLDQNKELELDVQEHEYNGKTSLRVQWINIPGAAKKRMSKKDATRKLASLNIAGELIRLHDEMGTEKVKKEKVADDGYSESSESFDSSDIPF